jgi:heptosyltransferase-2
VNTTPATLVIAPAWIGDAVMAQPLLALLANAAPVDVLAPPATAALFGRMPGVRSVLTAGFRRGALEWTARRQLGAALRAQAYARAVVLPNSWKSALAPWFAGVPVRTGYTGEARWGLLNDRRANPHKRAQPQWAQYYALGLPPAAGLPQSAPRPVLLSPPEARAVALAALGLEAGRPALALCPGAEYGPAKRWPAAHFGAVARARLAAGWQVWLLGGAGDTAACAAVAEAAPGVMDVSGRTTLEHAVDVLAASAQVLSNDSGLMHIAAALGRPVLGVYGSTSPAYTPPLGERARALSLGLACSPCFARDCPLGHLDCLRRLPPDAVLTALESQLTDSG